MRTRRFEAFEFTATKWESADQKAEFANHLRTCGVTGMRVSTVSSHYITPGHGASGRAPLVTTADGVTITLRSQQISGVHGRTVRSVKRNSK